jgi:quinol-cytochrome oxidoreductase complex cytochrome b subunit
VASERDSISNSISGNAPMKTLRTPIRILFLIAIISAVNLLIHISIDYGKGRSVELGPFFTFLFVVMVLSSLSLAVIGIIRLFKERKNDN